MKPADGDVYASVSHGVVDRTTAYGVHLKSDAGFSYSATQDVIDKEYTFAGYYDKEYKVTLVEMEAAFRSIGSTVFKVVFSKQPDPKAVVEAIDSADWGNAPPKKKRKVAKELLVGESRTLYGRLNFDPYHPDKTTVEQAGWIKVRDLKLETNNVRLVDIRTVSELVVHGIRYVRK